MRPDCFRAPQSVHQALPLRHVEGVGVYPPVAAAAGAGVAAVAAEGHDLSTCCFQLLAGGGELELKGLEVAPGVCPVRLGGQLSSALICQYRRRLCRGLVRPLLGFE